MWSRLNYAYKHRNKTLKIAMSEKQFGAFHSARTTRFVAMILDIAAQFYVSRRHGRRLGKTTLLAWVTRLVLNIIKGNQTHPRLHWAGCCKQGHSWRKLRSTLIVSSLCRLWSMIHLRSVRIKQIGFLLNGRPIFLITRTIIPFLYTPKTWSKPCKEQKPCHGGQRGKQNLVPWLAE